MIRVLAVLVVAAVAIGCAQSSPPSGSSTGGGAITVAGSTAPSAVTVSVPLNFRTHLAGRTEVPVRDTQGQGQAIFQLNPAGTELSYRLIASNIDNVTQAHIHLGPPTGTGGIVVWLFPSTAAGPANPPNGGRTDGVLAAGVIHAAELRGALAGQSLSALITHIQNGNAYVNVHTDDGQAPTNTGPGDFPGGEIRGQL